MLKNIGQLTKSPRQMLLLDGVGALVSSASAWLMFLNPHWVGLPTDSLFKMAIAASLFSIYSLCAFRFASSKISVWLGVICTLNGFYACAAIYLMSYFIFEITLFGLLYFSIELLVLLAVITLEIATIRRASKSN